MTDDWTPKPVPPSEVVRAIGPAVGKPAGIQAPHRSVSDEEVMARLENQELPERTLRGKKAWETRRANRTAHALPDKHYTGQHPYDIAIAALHVQRARIDDVIKTLEELKGGRL